MKNISCSSSQEASCRIYHAKIVGDSNYHFSKIQALSTSARDMERFFIHSYHLLHDGTIVENASVTVSNGSYVRVMHGKKLADYEKYGTYLIRVHAVSLQENGAELPYPYSFPTVDPPIHLGDVTSACVCVCDLLRVKTI